MSVNYNGTEYYYLRNGQGDIVGLLDGSGKKVVSYSYDSWGKLVSTTGTLAGTLGKDNRYREYYYDEETGLYWLLSRYYDPEVGRFINADEVSYLGADGAPISYNLYAYCKNNPINGSDYTGHWSWKDVFKAATVVTVVALAVAAIVLSGGSAAPPLLAAVSAASGTAASASTVATVATGIAIGGFTAMGIAAAASIYESTGSNPKQEKKYRGSSSYNKGGERIDYEYYGNGNGNVHYDGTKGKEILWRLQEGEEITYTVSKAVNKIICQPPIQKAISRAIDIVRALVGLE